MRKLTTVWSSNDNTQKKKRIKRKPKIRWQQLGLENPKAQETASSIDEIRREVILLASRGLGQGVKSRLRVEGAQPSDSGKNAGRNRK